MENDFKVLKDLSKITYNQFISVIDLGFKRYKRIISSLEELLEIDDSESIKKQLNDSKLVYEKLSKIKILTVNKIDLVEEFDDFLNQEFIDVVKKDAEFCANNFVE